MEKQQSNETTADAIPAVPPPASGSLSEQVAAAVATIPDDQLKEANAWVTEYLRQVDARLPDEHVCAMNRAMDGTCFICGANVKITHAEYERRDYINAMVEARRERDDLSSKLLSESIDAHEWLETVAKAVGIQTGRESWWDSNEKEQRAKVLERIKRLRANSGVRCHSDKQGLTWTERTG